MAAQYAGEERELQRGLVESMLLAGELGLAQQHLRIWGLEGELVVHPQRLAEEQQRRRELYLQMPLPASDVHFVDCVAGVATMQRSLYRLLSQPPPSLSEEDMAEGQLLPVLGVDLEWRPGDSGSRGSSSALPPSVLQISTGVC